MKPMHIDNLGDYFDTYQDHKYGVTVKAYGVCNKTATDGDALYLCQSSDQADAYNLTEEFYVFKDLVVESVSYDDIFESNNIERTVEVNINPTPFPTDYLASISCSLIEYLEPDVLAGDRNPEILVASASLNNCTNDSVNTWTKIIWEHILGRFWQ